ncbi:hypothetical protein MKX01_021494 [Papaver californicum]|nr:hypothetical protein MKX01_021494 [Papaver californicum]
MASKISSTTALTFLIFLTCLLLYLSSTILPFFTPQTQSTPPFSNFKKNPPPCNYFKGEWISDPAHKPIYDSTCPFHRNAWNCLKNSRENMEKINSWKWVPENCGDSFDRIHPDKFLEFMRDKSIGFIGDSLNENFITSFLCILRGGDDGAMKWKGKKGVWRGGYFPKFNVTVAYHRAVLLANYEFQPIPQLDQSKYPGLKGVYRVDVDVPSDKWIDVTKFYDVLVFNTGHWWGYDKFPKETPLVFYRHGKPIVPPLGIRSGLKVVLESMVSYIQREVPLTTLKFWRLQSPRHFYGGDWNQNGSCLFDSPFEESQLDIWFSPSNKGVNKEVRQVNSLIEDALQGTDIQLLPLTHLSEFRADAHPAIWLGKKDAVAVWGQDCMHWCLPGLPDTWVDILSALIHYNLRSG